MCWKAPIFNHTFFHTIRRAHLKGMRVKIPQVPLWHFLLHLVSWVSFCQKIIQTYACTPLQLEIAWIEIRWSFLTYWTACQRMPGLYSICYVLLSWLSAPYTVEACDQHTYYEYTRVFIINKWSIKWSKCDVLQLIIKKTSDTNLVIHIIWLSLAAPFHSIIMLWTQMSWCWWCKCEQFPLAGIEGKMVNYWRLKCGLTLMDVEQDCQEAHNDRNICQGEQQWWTLELQTSKMHPLLWIISVSFLHSDLKGCVPSGFMNASQYNGPFLDSNSHAVTQTHCSVCRSSNSQGSFKGTWGTEDKIKCHHGSDQNVHMDQIDEIDASPSHLFWSVTDFTHLVLCLEIQLCTLRSHIQCKNVWFCQCLKICCNN